MRTRDEALDLAALLKRDIAGIFPSETIETILYGSYARNDADEGSDIDVLFLVDSPRNVIAAKNWQIGEAAGEILIEHGIVISPIVENRDFFNEYQDPMPFFGNIKTEGIRLDV